MANIVPQLQVNNCGIWLKIEQTIKQMALENFDKTHVWSGPIYDSSQQLKYLSKKRIPIPIHLFKVIMVEKGEKCFSFAVVIANTSENKVYLVKISELEAITGLNFPEQVKKAEKNPPLTQIGSNPEQWILSG